MAKGKKRNKKNPRRRPAAARRNPPKMRPLTKSTGWMDAKRVKLIRRRGGMEVMIEKPRRRSR